MHDNFGIDKCTVEASTFELIKVEVEVAVIAPRVVMALGSTMLEQVGGEEPWKTLEMRALQILSQMLAFQVDDHQGGDALISWLQNEVISPVVGFAAAPTLWTA